LNKNTTTTGSSPKLQTWYIQ